MPKTECPNCGAVFDQPNHSLKAELDYHERKRVEAAETNARLWKENEDLQTQLDTMRADQPTEMEIHILREDLKNAIISRDYWRDRCQRLEIERKSSLFHPDADAGPPVLSGRSNDDPQTIAPPSLYRRIDHIERYLTQRFAQSYEPFTPKGD